MGCECHRKVMVVIMLICSITITVVELLMAIGADSRYNYSYAVFLLGVACIVFSSLLLSIVVGCIRDRSGLMTLIFLILIIICTLITCLVAGILLLVYAAPEIGGHRSYNDASATTISDCCECYYTFGYELCAESSRTGCYKHCPDICGTGMNHQFGVGGCRCPKIRNKDCPHCHTWQNEYWLWHWHCDEDALRRRCDVRWAGGWFPPLMALCVLGLAILIDILAWCWACTKQAKDKERRRDRKPRRTTSSSSY